MSNDHTIENIPANELVVMTEAMHRLFTVGGCDPTCHGCHKKLKIGKPFKLAEITKANLKDAQARLWPDFFKSKKLHEVMLCEKCTPKSMIDAAYTKQRQTPTGSSGSSRGNWLAPGGCSRINGKIVP